MTKELLQLKREELLEEMFSSSRDFVEDYEITDSCYFGDAITEWADSRVSIYYADQRQYYYEHAEECDYALTNFYDGETLAEKIRKEGLDSVVCLAGACGEYEAITSEIYEDEEKIKQVWIVDYLIKYFNESELIQNITEEELEELLANGDKEDINHIDDLLDFLKDNLSI